MRKTTYREYGEAELLAAVTVFEERYRMASAVFVERFCAGEFDDFPHNRWMHLLDELRDLRAGGAPTSLGLVDEARSLAPAV